MSKWRLLTRLVLLAVLIAAVVWKFQLFR